MPLNWHLADTHAIYWAVKGLKIAGKKNEQTELDMDELNTDRIIYHSLQNLFFRGKMIIYPAPIDANAPLSAQQQQQRVFTFPNLRMFEPYHKAMLSVMDKYTKSLDGRSG